MHTKINEKSNFWTPFGGAFWPFMAPQGADLASPCRFWSIFWTPLPWRPKWALGAPRWGQKGQKREVPRLPVDVPWPSWKRRVLRRGPESHSYRFWDPLG